LHPQRPSHPVRSWSVCVRSACSPTALTPRSAGRAGDAGAVVAARVAGSADRRAFEGRSEHGATLDHPVQRQRSGWPVRSAAHWTPTGRIAGCRSGSGHGRYGGSDEYPGRLSVSVHGVPVGAAGHRAAGRPRPPHSRAGGLCSQIRSQNGHQTVQEAGSGSRNRPLTCGGAEGI